MGRARRPMHSEMERHRSIGPFALFACLVVAVVGLAAPRADAAGAPHAAADLDLEPIGSSPAGVVAIGPLVFFTADDGLHGTELWRSDGHPAGTAMVAD